MSAYDEINSLYPKMQEIERDNVYGYKQLYNTTMPAVAVGSMVDDEHIQLSGDQNPTTMTTFQKWGVLDTAENCMANAQKMYSQILFNENKNIDSGAITKTSGFLTRSVQLRSIDDYKQGIFDSANYQTVTNISQVSAGFIYEYYTYFCPSQSGTYTFSIASMDAYFLWINNDNAIYDYKPSNSDVNKNLVDTENGYKFAKVTLKIGEYYPLRIHLYSTVDVTTPVYITNPDGTSVFDDSGYMYFNVLNGGDYNRKLLYYGLRKDSNNSTGYKCDFLDMIPDNYDNIQRMKNNQPILYKKLVIPTPITYTSHIYTSQGSDGNIVQMKCPVGGKIIVDSATWGTGPIEVNEPTYETREYSDPNIIIDTNTTTYNWATPVDSTTNIETTWANGMKIMLYDGDSKGNPSWYNGQTPSNKNSNKTGLEYPTTTTSIVTTESGKSVWISGYINGQTNSTYGSSWPGFVGGFQLTTTTGQTATLIIKDTASGTITITSTNGAVTTTGDGAKIGFPDNVPNVYSIDIYANAGTVTVKTIRWVKGWYMDPYAWYEFEEAANYCFPGVCDVFFTTQNQNKQITVTEYPDKENNAQLTTRAYIKPTPSYQAEIPNVVTYDGSVDITRDIQTFIDTNAPTTDSAGNNLYSLDGIYASKYDDLLPNNVAQEQTNKQLTVKYKYTIELTSADVTEKKILVNNYGQMSISYKYNDETSEYPIAPALNQNNYCDPSNCNYILTLEDNCSLATKNGGVVVTRDLQSELNADLANYGMTADNIIVNDNWKNDPINIFSTLNNGDILTNDNTIEVEAPLKRLSYIRSDNGKFKLTFEGDDLSVVYCIPSYFSSNNISYITNLHVTSSENPKPYYFLYRPVSNPLTGKIIYTQKNKATGASEARIVPFSHTDILSNGPISSKSNQYPVLCNSQSETCDSQISFQNLTGIVDNKYYLIDVSSNDECADKCLSSPDCLHFFHINTSNGEQKCLRDTVGNPNPLSTTTNPDPEYISASTISTRTYMVNSDCMLGDNDVKSDSVSAFSNYKTLYNEEIPNNVSKTFICGDPKYQEISNTIDQYFRGDTPSATAETIEPFDGTCGTAQCLIDELDNIAATYSTQYLGQQSDVNIMAKKIDRQYKDLGVNVAKEDIDRLQKEIPSKYTKTFYTSRPATNTLDIQESDSKDIALYENTLYTIGTLSVATMLIATIIILKD